MVEPPILRGLCDSLADSHPVGRGLLRLCFPPVCPFSIVLLPCLVAAFVFADEPLVPPHHPFAGGAPGE